MNREQLRKIWLFETLDDTSLDRLAQLFEEITLPPNHTIFRLGESSDHFYVLRTGSVAIIRDAVGKPVQLLARLKTGDFFGEAGLLDRIPRSASARTLEPSRLWRASREDFLEFLQFQPLLKVQLRRAAIERHSANVTTTANDRSTRKEVRIRVDRQVLITLPDGSRVEAQLDNLSLGGAALEGAPKDWRIQRRVTFQLGVEEEPELLDLAAVITWRKGSKVGLSFREQSPELRIGISRALQELLAGRERE